MLYKEFGKTGVKLSTLGFGAMRLPMIPDGSRVDYDTSTPLMHRAFELGVNYIDTAPYYCNNDSEVAIGKALKGWRDKVYISTKNPSENVDPKVWRDCLELSLKKLDADYIDFYHCWGIYDHQFRNWETLKDGPLQQALKAKEEGLIKHICFSFHDTEDKLRHIVDSGFYETILIQYNLLDRSNEENLAYCKEKGLGVAVMGPVGGGRLGAPSNVIKSLLKNKPESSAEMALRFVLSNPNVDLALSGMSTIAMVEENVKIASKGGGLTDAELSTVKTMMEENSKLAELYCTACNYCMPCPQEINIPYIFEVMNYHKVYELTNHARFAYDQLKKGEGWDKSTMPDKCTECKICESKCPQKLPIINQLKETHKTLS